MAAPNRTTKIQSLFKLLQKRYKHAPQTPERSVLEHLIFAACLENATFEQAENAFAVLEHHYIDWNEVRVSTPQELAYTFPQLPDPLAAGDRIRKALQAVFETTYVFDLEDLRKKNLSQAVDYLESTAVCSRFMVDYTTQNALGGHVIPLDEAALRIFRLLGLTQVNKDQTREEVGGLERAIPKNQGPAFANLLHFFATEFYGDVDGTKLRPLLKPIDAQALSRDCTPPALVSLKPARPHKQRPVAPSISAVDEDADLIDESIGVEEVEFIPNPITGEEVAFEADEDEEFGDHALKAGGKGKSAGKKKGSKKPDAKEIGSKGISKKEPAVGKEAAGKKTPAPKSARPSAPKAAAKPEKKAVSLKSPKSKSGKANTPPEKKGTKTLKGKPAAKQLTGKKDLAKKPPTKLVPSKQAAKSKSNKPAKPSKAAPAKSGKSPTRTLRQRKPK